MAQEEWTSHEIFYTPSVCCRQYLSTHKEIVFTKSLVGKCSLKECSTRVRRLLYVKEMHTGITCHQGEGENINMKHIHMWLTYNFWHTYKLVPIPRPLSCFMFMTNFHKFLNKVIIIFIYLVAPSEFFRLRSQSNCFTRVFKAISTNIDRIC